MTLWKWLEVPLPTSSTTAVPLATSTPTTKRETLLIWGGSTITGQFAIQIAKLSGLRVLAVTSSKTASLAQELGAEVIIRDAKTNSEILEDILALAGGEAITKCIDLVGPKTASYCLKALSKDMEEKCIFAPLAMMGKDEVVGSNVEVVTVEMKKFVNEEACRSYAVLLNGLVGEGLVSLPEILVLEGGVEGVVAGLERLKGGEMGGVKLVVKMV